MSGHTEQDALHWKPIDGSEPRDGTFLLVWMEGEGLPLILAWEPGYDAWGDGLTLYNETPTHWMPLPGAPDSRAKQTEGSSPG